MDVGDLVRATAGPARSPRPRSAVARRPSAAPDPPPRAAARPCPARPPDRPAAPTGRRSAGSRWRDRRESPSPGKRYCSTSAQVRPDSSSPHRAARAIRRSPGGRQFSSSTEPAGRAAVVGHGDDRGQPVGDPTQRAERGADSPCPPPNATTAGSWGRPQVDRRTGGSSRRSSLTGPCHGRSFSRVQERSGTTRLSSFQIVTNERDLAELRTAKRGARPSYGVIESLPPHVAVQDLGRHPRLPQSAAELLGHRRAAVLASGAPDGDRGEPLALR